MALTPALDPTRLGAHYAVGEALLGAAFDVLNAQELEPPTRGLVVIGDLPDDCCNTVVVALRSLDPVRASAGECEPLQWTASWAVTIIRSAKDTLGSVYNQLPTDEQEAAANSLLFADLAVLLWQFAPQVPRVACAAVPGLASRDPGYVKGRCVPHRLGECNGWTYDFRLTMPG